MSKSLNYEELWDSFTPTEREALVSNLPNWRTVYGNETVKKWKHLPTTLKFELGAVDWEFSLGKHFTSPS
jgi:hypothetical protein